MRTTMLYKAMALLCLCLGLSRGGHAAEVSAELGTLGDITTWLMIKSPEWRIEIDPFAPMGGEAKYAAMGDAKLLPYGGNPLEIPGTNVNQKIRIGDGVWEAARMVMPDMPGVWNDNMRLVVPVGFRYAYCQLDSPEDRKANLLIGLGGMSARLSFNGTDIGTYDHKAGNECARELPVQLKKGINHLFIRFVNHGPASLACRLIGENAAPLLDVKNRIGVPNPNDLKAPEPAPIPANERFTNIISRIAPPAPPAHPEFLGARLARTMTLLESGKYTHRPVRIIFSGQSIETDWTRLLVQRLRERYPGTTIIAENRAIGGWFVWRMQKLLKHDILRWQPDLICFSAYQGTAEVWERFISEIRSETTADIIVRTQHGDNGMSNVVSAAQFYGPESVLLHRLAQKYDVELVEASQEWFDYLAVNKLSPKALLRDGIHLNEKGEALMAMLYERHFKYNAASRQGWANTVRPFDVGRFLEDNATDEIVLEGDGWSRTGRGYAQSSNAADRLKLKFSGTRVDLVMPPFRRGGATVLIDGKTPSEWNLFHGTRPQGRTRAVWPPIMTYHTGKNMQAETWVLTLTEGNVDADPKKANQRVKFKLTGSKTGFDGEGQNDKTFVSKSGRITILTTDWMTAMNPPDPKEPPPVMQAFTNQPQTVWHIVPDGIDVLAPKDAWAKDTDYYSGQPYDYVTVADGLPCGVHELTLSPLPNEKNHPFTISGIEVHRPPLARDVSERTR
jgi:hypothetical protein